MSETTPSQAGRRRGNGVQFCIALFAAVTIGAAGGYLLLRPALAYARDAAEQVGVLRASAESQRSRSAAEAAKLARPDPRTEPMQAETKRWAELAKRVDPAATPHPPAAEAEAVRKLAVAVLGRVVDKAFDGAPNAVTERLAASALAESDGMAALGITFPAFEARILGQLNGLRDSSLAVRWLTRILQFDRPPAGGAATPIPSRELAQYQRTNLLIRLDSAAREAGDFPLALRALDENIALLQRTNPGQSEVLAPAIGRRAQVLVALGRLAEAGPALRDAWSTLSAAPRKEGKAWEMSGTGCDYARFLLAQGKPEQALEVMESVTRKLDEWAAPRDGKPYLKSQIFRAYLLGKLNRAADADWISRELALVLEVQLNLQTGWGEPDLGKSLAEAEQWPLAEEFYWAELLCSLFDPSGRTTLRTVKGLVQMAESSPEGAKAVGDVLPVYRRWLKRMDAKALPKR